MNEQVQCIKRSWAGRKVYGPARPLKFRPGQFCLTKFSGCPTHPGVYSAPSAICIATDVYFTDDSSIALSSCKCHLGNSSVQ